MIKKTFYILSVLAILAFSHSASAQMFTDKTKLELKAKPGETLIENITVYNTTKEKLDLKVYWQDFIYLPPYDGKKDFLPLGTTPYSLGDAVTFSPKQLILPPDGNAKINVSIQIPEAAQNGGYYGVLFYEKTEPAIAPGTGVKIVTRLGTLFFIETDWRNKSADVQNIKATAKGLEGSFSNKGNIFLTLKGSFYVLNSDGMVEDRGETNKLYLTPGAEGTFKFDFSDTLAAGTYTAVITFDLKEGTSVVREVDFEKSTDGQVEVIAVRE